MTNPAPADDITLPAIQRAGSTLYVLNASGTNIWSAQVQPGRTDDDKRLPDAECERIAAILAGRASPSRATVPACLNAWFLSLPEGRQAVLRDDKWMLAHSAFDAGLAAAPGSASPPAAVDVGAAQAETAQAAPDEQSAFEDWLSSESPSGDVESVQRQWLGSSAFRNFIDEQDAARATPGATHGN